ncbi:uncharacterized protein [Parasteatoda tepidariorum]|uniref:uncharacterized protein n=1 Tax=Parasteatoda tepidariorum TaxID=114398 RepID=UPI001C727FB1|nr:uncharacterized protein LOC122270927 [Parasteatoda tepidariorum]
MDVVPGTLLLLLSTIVGSSAEREQNCTAQEFADCFTVLEAISQREDLALAATQDELNLVCRKLKQGVKCIEDHSFRCFSVRQKRVFKSVVSESKHVIDDICVPGKLQEDYLRYAPCLKNVSTDHRKCANQYKRLANNHGGNPEEQTTANINYGLKMHCCAFSEFVECQHTYIQRDCGHHAHQFYQSQLERMSGSLLNEHCAIFTHGSNACLFNQNDGYSLKMKCFSYRSLLLTVFAVVVVLIFTHR